MVLRLHELILIFSERNNCILEILSYYFLDYTMYYSESAYGILVLVEQEPSEDSEVPRRLVIIFIFSYPHIMEVNFCPAKNQDCS